jgi:hypothetical protein
MMLLSTFFRLLVLVLVMLPIAARGELVLSAFGWSGTGTSLHFDGTKTRYQEASLESSADGRFQNLGIGFGFTWWFGRDFFFGMFGLEADAVPAKADVWGANMKGDLITVCFVFRLPPKGFPFLHGRLVPYAGFGYSGLHLDGEAAIFSGTKEDYSFEPLTEKALTGKIGLEWMIIGPLAVFLEARFMNCSSSFDRVDDTHWYLYGGWIPVPVDFGEHIDAQLKCGQVCLGIALHF